jgi:hypothetical protein
VLRRFGCSHHTQLHTCRSNGISPQQFQQTISLVKSGKTLPSASNFVLRLKGHTPRHKDLSISTTVSPGCLLHYFHTFSHINLHQTAFWATQFKAPLQLHLQLQTNRPFVALLLPFTIRPPRSSQSWATIPTTRPRNSAGRNKIRCSLPYRRNATGEFSKKKLTLKKGRGARTTVSYRYIGSVVDGMPASLTGPSSSRLALLNVLRTDQSGTPLFGKHYHSSLLMMAPGTTA